MLPGATGVVMMGWAPATVKVDTLAIAVGGGMHAMYVRVPGASVVGRGGGITDNAASGGILGAGGDRLMAMIPLGSWKRLHLEGDQ